MRPVVGVLIEPSAAGEDDEGDLGIAEHGELVGLLEEAIPAFAEGDLAIGGALNSLDLNLASPIFAFLVAKSHGGVWGL